MEEQIVNPQPTVRQATWLLVALVATMAVFLAAAPVSGTAAIPERTGAGTSDSPESVLADVPPHAGDHGKTASEQEAPEAGTAGGPAALPASPKDDLAEIEKDWGVKFLGLRLTAAGYAINLRYEVLDPEKAAPLLVKRLSPNPHVIVEKSGAKLHVPFSEKVGTMRTSVRTAAQIKKNRHYFALFANPGRHVKAGDKVTLVFGKFRAEHVVVE